MAPPSLRRVLPPETLAAFGAAPLYPAPEGGDDALPVAPPSVAARARGGRPSPRARTTPRRLGAPPPHGLEVGGWRIATRSSAIGDEGGMEGLTALLEEVANDAVAGDESRGSGKKRRLCPPEIAFLDAVVSLRYQNENTSGSEVDEGSDGDGAAAVELRFTARDALLEWAEAHRYFETQQDDSEEASIVSSREGVRGVSILRTADAQVWSKKPRNGYAADAANSEFYYDWTFSSPYAGTILYAKINKSAAGEEKAGCISNRRQWQPLQRSHIPFRLLQDTSQPILLFDDVHLYEDDLHDNGDVSLSVKIRVMPRCWYVLQRLFVRVDRVLVRCREVRYFCLFDGGGGGGNDGAARDVRANAVYRDVTWREAAWDELAELALPTDPAAWREGEDVLGGSAAPRVPAPPPVASLLARLPAATLPDDLPRFSYFDVVEEENIEK